MQREAEQRVGLTKQCEAKQRAELTRERLSERLREAESSHDAEQRSSLDRELETNQQLTKHQCEEQEAEHQRQVIK